MKRVLLCSVCCAALIAAPYTPARAEYPVVDNQLNSTVKSEFESTRTGVYFWLQRIVKQLETNRQTDISLQAGKVEAETNLKQAELNQEHLFIKAQKQAEIAVNKASSPRAKKFLCDTVSVGQGRYAAKSYAELIHKNITRKKYDFAFAENYPKCTGPDAGHGDAKKCRAGLSHSEIIDASCALQTVDPQDLPAGDKCAATREEMIRADRKVETIFGTLRYVDPKNKKKPAELPIEQHRFLAAVNFCYTLKGTPNPRPTGDESKEPGAAHALAAFERNDINVGAIFEKCMQIVADHTRPDCQSSSAGLLQHCETMNGVCNIAKSHGMDVTKYGNCQVALSHEEVREIENTLCLTTTSVSSLASTTTASEENVIEEYYNCLARVEAYHSNKRREYDDFVSLIINFMKD